MDQDALALMIATVPRDHRPAIAALFALDARLGAILRSTSEPMIGQLRLAWWREALKQLDCSPSPAEPVLVDTARHVLPRGVKGAALATMTVGWEALLDASGPGTNDALVCHARRRGETLFAAAAAVLGGPPPPSAGEAWALADLARHTGSAEAADRARHLASTQLAGAFSHPFPRSTRPLGVLALLSAFDLRSARPLRDAISLVGFRLTGRHRLEIGE